MEQPNLSDALIEVVCFDPRLGSQKWFTSLLSLESLSAIPFKIRLAAKTNNS
ncbi:hypothetical protein APA_3816 [Pseudanabaena sp. lw0831]|nr:hypothetical protein APA_3816 [Pseudanabaena sp. lw0831]